MTQQSISQTISHNVATFSKQPLAEISGSLGDLGTFLPILISLSEGNQISLTTTLVFSGAYNIFTGLYFGIPLPVQPMKAIAAVAILKHLSAGEVAAAGIFVSACIFMFSATGLLTWFTNVIPVPVVKGIQVGAGFSLIIAAATKATNELSWLRPSWADNFIWMIVAFVFLLLINIRPKIPYALIATIVGIIFALTELRQSMHHHLPHLHKWHLHSYVPRPKEWQTGIIDAGIGQLPLTTLNSIVAVTYLAADLLPEITTPSVTSIGFSVAAMNLFGCWFGAMPMCHGSGGLAAQYHFGARSGASIIFLGVIKILLGLIFGESLKDLLHKFPTAFLSVMIIAAGLELASVGESLNTSQARDLIKDRGNMGPHSSSLTPEQRKERFVVMLVTATVLVGFKNDAIGFVAGLLCHASYQLHERLYHHRTMEDVTPEERRSLLP